MRKMLACVSLAALLAGGCDFINVSGGSGGGNPAQVVEVNPAAGTRFDPHQHQAISVVPAAQEPNTVVAVLQKGYLIADRVLRPALVTVSTAAEAA